MFIILFTLILLCTSLACGTLQSIKSSFFSSSCVMWGGFWGCFIVECQCSEPWELVYKSIIVMKFKWDMLHILKCLCTDVISWESIFYFYKSRELTCKQNILICTIVKIWTQINYASFSVFLTQPTRCCHTCFKWTVFVFVFV